MENPRNSSERFITAPFVSSGDKLDVTIRGAVLSTPDGPLLEILPGIVLRVDCDAKESRKAKFLFLSIADKDTAKNPVTDEIDYGSVKEFSVRLRAGDTPISGFLKEGNVKVPVEMNIIFETGSGTYTSPPIKAFLNSTKKSEKAFMKSYGDALFTTTVKTGIIFPLGIVCFFIWWITSGIFWTRCVGGCLPVVTNCKCFSPVSLKWRTLCGGWVPCFCVPWYV